MNLSNVLLYFALKLARKLQRLSLYHLFVYSTFLAIWQGTLIIAYIQQLKRVREREREREQQLVVFPMAARLASLYRLKLESVALLPFTGLSRVFREVVFSALSSAYVFVLSNLQFTVSRFYSIHSEKKKSINKSLFLFLSTFEENR